MKAILAAFATHGNGRIGASWECRVLAPALFWAFPILSQGRFAVDIMEEPMNPAIKTVRPSFWPAATQLPLDTPLIDHSDHGDLRTISAEADRVWDNAKQYAVERGDWLRMLGAHRCMDNILRLPFMEVAVKLSFSGPKDALIEALDELTAPHRLPETRLFGYKLTYTLDNTFKLKTPTPDWVIELI